MSARKKLIIVLAAAIVIATIVVLALVIPGKSAPGRSATLPVRTYRLTIAGISGEPAHGRMYYASVARTTAEQATGLGGVMSIPHDHGMLFIYATDTRRCFWMKDMRFAIDMIWLDSTKAVTHIEPDVQPGTYPQMFCYVGSYVIELNAGEAARNHLQSGQKITF